MKKTKQSLVTLAFKAGATVLGGDAIADFGDVHSVLTDGHDALNAIGHLSDTLVIPEIHMPDLAVLNEIPSVADWPTFSVPAAEDIVGSSIADAMPGGDIPDIGAEKIDLIDMACGLPFDVNGNLLPVAPSLQDLGYYLSPSRPGENAEFGGVFGGLPTNNHGNGPMDGQGNNPYRNGHGSLPKDIWGNPWTGPV